MKPSDRGGMLGFLIESKRYLNNSSAKFTKLKTTPESGLMFQKIFKQ